MFYSAQHFNVYTQITSMVQVANPILFKAFRKPKVTGLLQAAALVLNPNTLTIQKDPGGGEFVLFEPWLYYTKSQDWAKNKERRPFRGGWSSQIKVPLTRKHLTEQMDDVDFHGRRPSKQNLLKVKDVTTAMREAYQRDPTQFVYEALAANELLGYDGEPTFSDNHTDITGKSPYKNLGILNVDFANRTTLSRPTVQELYEEVLTARVRMCRNQRGIVRFQETDQISRMTVIVRSEETALTFEKLNINNKITTDEENRLRGKLHIVQDLEYTDFGVDPNTYDLLAGTDPGEDVPRAFALSTVRPPLGLDVLDASFAEQLVMFGLNYHVAIGPWSWSGAWRNQP